MLSVGMDWQIMVVSAYSVEEVIGKGIVEARKLYPIENGYGSHSADAVQVPNKKPKD